MAQGEEPLSSVAHDQWCEIAEAVRQQLARRVEQMPDMNVSELYELVETIDNAHWMEVKVRNWDAALREHAASLAE